MKILLILLLTAMPLMADSFGVTDTSGLDVTSSFDIEDDIYGTPFTATGTGTGDSICFWSYALNSARNVKCALYRYGDMSLLDTTELVSILTTDTAWYYFSFINSPAIKEDTVYVVTAYGEDGVGNVYRIRDPETGVDYLYQLTVGTSYAWPTPSWTDTTRTSDYQIVIGCYFTSSSGGSLVPFIHTP